MAKHQSRFLLWQKALVGAIALVSIAVFGYFYTLIISEAPLGEFVEGEHYFRIEEPRRVRGDRVEVMEFFSYGCIHCYNFDNDLNNWVDKNTESVTFVRMPATSNTTWRLLARTYYTMEEMDILEDHHSALFRAIHEVRRRLDSAEAITTFLEERGVDPVRFRSIFNSSMISGRIQRADQLVRQLKVPSVPAIVINGEYLVRPTPNVGLSRMLDVMDHLVTMRTSTGKASPSD